MAGPDRTNDAGATALDASALDTSMRDTDRVHDVDLATSFTAEVSRIELIRDFATEHSAGNIAEHRATLERTLQDSLEANSAPARIDNIKLEMGKLELTHPDGDLDLAITHLEQVVSNARLFLSSPDIIAERVELLATAHERAGHSEKAEALQAEAQGLEVKHENMLNRAEDLVALEIPDSIDLVALGSVTDRDSFIVNLGEEDKAVILETLSDDFHEAWKAVHFKGRGEGAQRWKPTSDLDWAIQNHEALSSGEPWIRQVDENGEGRIEVDIAHRKNSQLPADRQGENLTSPQIAFNGIMTRLNENGIVTAQDVIEIAAVIHSKWLERNTWVQDSKYDTGDDQFSQEVRLMRLPFDEMFERGATDPVAANEAIKDVEAVIASIDVLNEFFKGKLDGESLMDQVKTKLAL